MVPLAPRFPVGLLEFSRWEVYVEVMDRKIFLSFLVLLYTGKKIS